MSLLLWCSFEASHTGFYQLENFWSWCGGTVGQGTCYILAWCSSMINQEFKHLLQLISQCAMALRFLRTLLRQRPSYQVIHMSLAICARQLLHKYINSKKLYLGLLLLIQKKGSECLPFIITSVLSPCSKMQNSLNQVTHLHNRLHWVLKCRSLRVVVSAKHWKWNQLCEVISPFVVKKLSTILQFVDQMLVKSWMFSTLERLQPYLPGMPTYWLCLLELNVVNKWTSVWDLNQWKKA